MSSSLVAAVLALATQMPAPAPATVPESTEPQPAWRAALIADGLDPAQRARLDAALAHARVALLPAAEVERLRTELSAHGVDCVSDTTDCLARVTVLAGVERAIRVWPSDGALDVLVVDSTPRRARARLQHKDEDAGWGRALEAALALAPSDEPVALPPAADAAEPPVHVTIVNAPSEDTGPGVGVVAGAVALGAAAVGVGVAGVLTAFGIASVVSANDAHFQDDAVAHAADANLRFGLGAAVLGGSAIVAGVGVALLVIDLEEQG